MENKMLVTKVNGIDCGKFTVERNDGVSIDSPFLIGEDSFGDVIILSEDGKEKFTYFDSKLFTICDNEKSENEMGTLLIGEQESTVPEDWFEIDLNISQNL